MSNRFPSRKPISPEAYRDSEGWIGEDIVAPAKSEQAKLPQSILRMNGTSNPLTATKEGSFFAKTPESHGKSGSGKSPSQLMQDILKGLSQRSVVELNPYYDRENEELLAQLLTNRHKLTGFIRHIEDQMPSLDPEVVKHYEVLIILLQQTVKNDIEVKQSASGMEIRFNRSSLQRQEAEIERLHREIEEKERQSKQVVEEYESVIQNFNEVLQKLLTAKETKGRFDL